MANELDKIKRDEAVSKAKEEHKSAEVESKSAEVEKLIGFGDVLADLDNFATEQPATETSHEKLKN